MKKLLVCIFAASLFGCQDDLSNADENLTQSNGVTPQIVNRIKALGFDTESTPIYKSGEDYVVEGDIAIDALELQGDGITGKQRRTSGLLSCGNRLNIKVRNRLSGVHSRALQTAISNWNNNSNNLVSFTLVQSGQDINVRFATDTDNLSPTTAANARGPRSGKAGSLIRVNRAFAIVNRPWSTILTHELGHTIGFAHTNTQEGTYIAGSRRTDSESVMNRGGTTGCCISNGDRQALGLLYNGCLN